MQCQHQEFQAAPSRVSVPELRCTGSQIPSFILPNVDGLGWVGAAPSSCVREIRDYGVSLFMII